MKKQEISEKTDESGVLSKREAGGKDREMNAKKLLICMREK